MNAMKPRHILVAALFAFTVGALAALARSQGCGGCEPWVQDPLGVWWEPVASWEIALDTGRGCVSTLAVDMHAGAAGECGTPEWLDPKLPPMCAYEVAPCTFTLDFQATLAPGVRAYWNDGTHWLGGGPVWQEVVPQAWCAPAASVTRTARACDTYSFLWLLLVDDVSGASTTEQLTLGCFGCPTGG